MGTTGQDVVGEELWRSVVGGAAAFLGWDVVQHYTSLEPGPVTNVVLPAITWTILLGLLIGLRVRTGRPLWNLETDRVTYLSRVFVVLGYALIVWSLIAGYPNAGPAGVDGAWATLRGAPRLSLGVGLQTLAGLLHVLNR